MSGTHKCIALRNNYRKMLCKNKAAGKNPAACPVTALRRRLLAGRRAFADSRTHRTSLVDEDGARNHGRGQVVVRHRRVPTTASDVQRGEVVAGRGAPA